MFLCYQQLIKTELLYWMNQSFMNYLGTSNNWYNYIKGLMKISNVKYAWMLK